MHGTPHNSRSDAAKAAEFRGDGDAVTVVGSEREDAKDQEVERSLEKGIAGRGVFSS